MKTKKEIAENQIMNSILTSFMLVFITGIIMLLLIPCELTQFQTIIFSFFLAVIFTKMSLDKIHLENKIVELKEKLENK